MPTQVPNIGSWRPSLPLPCGWVLHETEVLAPRVQVARTSDAAIGACYRTRKREYPQTETIGARCVDCLDHLCRAPRFWNHFFDDAVIMGRTIFLLGLLSGANEALKLWVARPGGGYRGLRLVLAIAYVGLMLMGFPGGPSEP